MLPTDTRLGLVVGIVLSLSITSPVPGQTTRTLEANLGTRVDTILRVEAMGQPTERVDGRFEQRYRVVANVPFRLTMDGVAIPAAQVTRSETMPDAVYSGMPGVHNDIVLVVDRAPSSTGR
jgi:hypothetical protein